MTIASSSIVSTVDFGCLGPVGRSIIELRPVAPSQGPQALLTMLYRSTDRRCRRGAAMKNLANSASRHAGEKSAPSKPGIKHLGPPAIAGARSKRGAFQPGAGEISDDPEKTRSRQSGGGAS
jgi:hypothetical protein